MKRVNKNILITGITGLLGNALVQQSRDADNITGIYIGNYLIKDGPHVRYSIVDVRDEPRLKTIFKSSKFDVVIHAAGIANVDYCQNNFQEAYESNVLGTSNIVELCKRFGVRLVYISSNAIFDGENPPYKETDRPNPINNYGKIKLECESIILDSMNNSLIIRPILMYGWYLKYERPNFVTWVLESAKGQERVNIVTDVCENPLLSYQCADAIWRLLQRSKSGIYHVAGKDVLNRFEIAREVFDVFALDKSLLNPVESSFFKHLAPRPKNTSYCTDKIEKDINFIPLAFKEGLKIMQKFSGHAVVR